MKQTYVVANGFQVECIIISTFIFNVGKVRHTKDDVDKFDHDERRPMLNNAERDIVRGNYVFSFSYNQIPSPWSGVYDA